MRRTAGESSPPSQESFGFLEKCISDWRVHRRKVYLFTILSTAVALVVLLLLPNEYTATARFFPQEIMPTNQLSSLAASILPGDLLSSSNLPNMKSEGAKLRGLYKSNRFLDAVLNRHYESQGAKTSHSLYVLFNESHREFARRELLQRISLNEDIKSSIMTVEAKTYDPLLSANIANASVEELDKLKKTIDKKSIAEELAFLSTQINIENDNLNRVKKDQTEFLLKNRNYIISDDPVLRQEVTAHEEKVFYHAKVLTELHRMATAAEMSLNRDTPCFKLVEKAEVPLLKSGPPRLRYFLVSILGAFFFCVGIIFMVNAFRWYFPSHTRQEINYSIAVIRSDVARILYHLRYRRKSVEKVDHR